MKKRRREEEKFKKSGMEIYGILLWKLFVYGNLVGTSPL